jgi:hypothetical protein
MIQSARHKAAGLVTSRQRSQQERKGLSASRNKPLVEEQAGSRRRRGAGQGSASKEAWTSFQVLGRTDPVTILVVPWGRKVAAGEAVAAAPAAAAVTAVPAAVVAGVQVITQQGVRRPGTVTE